MWPFLRQEVERARRQLALPNDEFKPLAATAWRAVEEKVYGAFCRIETQTRPTWLWNSWNDNHPTAAWPCASWPAGVLVQLLPTPMRVFLMLNETHRGTEKFWWYEGTVAAVQAVIEEVAGLDEWTVVDKHYQWLLCFNHHDVLMGSGQTAVDAIQALAASKVRTK